MDNLKRNGEGYIDPTAYKAIIEADKPVAGDIFSADGAEWLVVAYNAPVMTVLKLFDERKSDSEIEIISRTKKYTDVRYIHYRFYVPNQYELVKALPESEYKRVIDAVRVALGVPACEKEIVMVEAKPIERVVESEETVKLRRECHALEHEVNVYKNLYQEMLDRLIAAH